MVPVRVFWRFSDNHGFALASNIAFSMLLSIFPFLLLLTGVTVWIGGDALGEVLQDLLTLLLPDAIADILQPDVDAVIAERTRSLLSISLIVFLVTLTSLVESLREGLNRAYGYYERRSILSRRAMGLLAVLGATVVMVVVAAALFFAPLAWNVLKPHIPLMQDFQFTFTVVRFGVAIPILALFLIASHRWLPMRMTEWADLWPGVLGDAFPLVDYCRSLFLLSIAFCSICARLRRLGRGCGNAYFPANHFDDLSLWCRGECLAYPLAAHTAQLASQALP